MPTTRMSDDARQLIQYVPWEDLFPELGGGPPSDNKPVFRYSMDKESFDETERHQCDTVRG
jgi:hypothetical protein